MLWLEAVDKWCNSIVARDDRSENQLQMVMHILEGPFVTGVASLHDMKSGEIMVEDVALQALDDLLKLPGVGLVTVQFAAAIIRQSHPTPWYMEDDPALALNKCSPDL